MVIRYVKTTAYQGYVASVGYTINKSNKVCQKVFYLGSDQSRALQIKAYIKSLWDDCKVKGNRVWTSEYLQSVKDYQHTVYGKEKSSKPIIVTSTFYGLIDMYIEKVIPCVIGSHGWKKKLRERMTYLKSSCPDFQLSKFDYDRLNEITSYWKNRPSSKTTHKPISVVTVSTQIYTLKRLLQWADTTDRWKSFKGWEKLLLLNNYHEQITDEELLEQSEAIATNQLNPTFSIDELVTLYQNADDEIRQWITLALNIGATQGELSELMRGEIRLGEIPPIIARGRRKSTRTRKPIVSKWTLWNETVSVINDLLHTAEMKTKKTIVDNAQRTGAIVDWSDITDIEKRDWLFNRPLVYENRNGNRIDIVHRRWDALLKKCPNVRHLGFKYLRKTGADFVERMYDLSTAQSYLCHKQKTMAQKHYTNRDYDKLFKALKELRGWLAPMFQSTITEPLPTDKTEGSQL